MIFVVVFKLVAILILLKLHESVKDVNVLRSMWMVLLLQHFVVAMSHDYRSRRCRYNPQSFKERSGKW